MQKYIFLLKHVEKNLPTRNFPSDVKIRHSCSEGYRIQFFSHYLTKLHKKNLKILHYKIKNHRLMLDANQGQNSKFSK